MLDVFDANCHLTVDGKFLSGYRKNMPATLENYLRQSTSYVNLKGFVSAALPGLYSRSEWEILERQIKTRSPIDGKTARAIEIQDLNSDAVFSDNSTKIMKIHEGMLGTLLTCQDLFYMMSLCQQYTVTLYICTYFSSRQCPWQSEHNLKGALEKLSELRPAVPIVLAHGAGSKFLEFSEFARHRENIYLDTSFTGVRFQDTSVLDDIIYALQNPKHKILFGSDWPDHSWEEISLLLERIRRRIPRDSLNRYLAGNAREVFTNAN